MFNFRLQRVLEHRTYLEQEAKQRFLLKKAERHQGEQELAAVRKRRSTLTLYGRDSLGARIEMQAHLLKADDDEKAAQIALGVLHDEEEAAERAWIASKMDLQVLQKLREKALDEWVQAEARREQQELDEWAVLRRSA